MSLGPSDITNISEAVEGYRFLRSLNSETAGEILVCKSVLYVGFPALPDDISEKFSADCEFGCAFCNRSSTLRVSSLDGFTAVPL